MLGLFSVATRRLYVVTCFAPLGFLIFITTIVDPPLRELLLFPLRIIVGAVIVISPELLVGFHLA